MFRMTATGRSQRQARLVFFSGFVGAVCLAMAGCGGDEFQVVPVSGAVTVDGKGAAGVVVTFQPVAEGKASPGPGSAGKTDANGRYVLQMMAEGNKAGAVTGKHRVTLATAPPDQNPTDDRPQKLTEVIPPKERGKTREFTVPAAGTDKADFSLTAK